MTSLETTPEAKFPGTLSAPQLTQGNGLITGTATSGGRRATEAQTWIPASAGMSGGLGRGPVLHPHGNRPYPPIARGAVSPIHRFIQAPTTAYHCTESCGFSTQWFSVGK